MSTTTRSTPAPRRLAALGGSYGNIAALAACIDDAQRVEVDLRAFLGDAIGCCGHSEEVIRVVRESFPVLVAGNHEQQAARDSESCGCGYASPEDEAISCEAFRLATEALSPESKVWLGTWPDRAIVELEGGRVLLCHGSPGNTNEFLYELELDDLRLEAWLDAFDVRGFICTHSGLPWIRRLRGGRFAVNCGAVGKPDHDGDPAVHYALIDLPACAEPTLEIRTVTYDHEAFARRMEQIGIADVFVSPVRTGVWTTGLASLPAAERHRPLRSSATTKDSRPTEPAAPSSPPEWVPELLSPRRFHEVLAAFRDLRLISALESDEVVRLLGPDCPFFAATRLADTLHLHVKVDDVAKLPHEKIVALGTKAENSREGYVKYSFDGGINVIFSSIDIAEEDTLSIHSTTRTTVLETQIHEEKEKPFLDHIGIDLRRETGIVRARFDEIPAIAQRIGWSHVQQGGRGRVVHCCHTHVAQKHWVYPTAITLDDGPFTHPLEVAYGPLLVSTEVSGCDLRPIDPRHPAALDYVPC